MYSYQAFQLTIQSQLLCPELHSLNHAHLSPVDVTINWGYVDPNGLSDPLKKGLFFQVKQDFFWLHVPNIAYFLVTQGRHIIINKMPGVDEDSLRVFVLGSCFGALLMQRNFLLLHGSAVKIGQYAVSFLGFSGVGKSTLSGILLKRGYTILADDICAVDAHDRILPGFPQIKLWADAAKQLAINTHSLRKIRPNIEKYAIPLREHFYPEPLSLKLIYILSVHNKNDVVINPLNGVDKFQSLRHQLYRSHYVKGLSQERAYRLRCGQLAHHIALARIKRPQSGYQFEKLADHIESNIASKGLKGFMRE